MLRRSAVRVELQERDIAFLRGMFECRVMTTKHVAALYFDGRGEMAKKRLQKLKSAGLVAERSRKQFEPAILFLTRTGIATLRAHGVLECYPAFDIATLVRRSRVSDITLRHELAVLDVKVAFHVAARSRGNLSVVEFTTWPRLNQFKVLGDVVKPDAFVHIRERAGDGAVRDHTFYVELDRSTEPLNTLCERARSYAAHYKSGHFAIQQGVSLADYQKRPFRVLYVLRSNERRDNIAQRLRAMTPQILSLVWLATFADTKHDPFKPIWKRPMDYKNEVPTATLLLHTSSMTHTVRQT